MRILLDTHTYFWWQMQDAKLSRRARELIEDQENEVLISAVIAWELATKSRIRHWPEGAVVLTDIDNALTHERLQALPISIVHARAAGRFSAPHGDPFDRMLAAQSQIEEVPLVTADPVFSTFGTRVLW